MPARNGGVQFVEAISYLKDRLALTDSEWRDLLQAAGARAETVVDDQAQSMRRDLLEAANEIFNAGGTAKDFTGRYQEITARHGWVSDGDPGWHSNLIWRMETFGAQAAGRWEQAWRLQRARPNVRHYFRYITAGDHRVRATHQQWHGIILPIDHPFWRTHFPPNGFNCRCHVMIVTDRELTRYGWAVTADTDPRVAIPPDPGFDTNVGMAWQELRGEAPSSLVPAVPATPPSPPAISLPRLFSAAESLPPATRIDIAQLPAVLVERMGAVDREVGLSAATIASHRHHGDVTAEVYGNVVPRLLATGQYIADQRRPNHGRFIGEVGGVLWAAIVKVDRNGRLWLSSLHRSNPKQLRQWLRK